MNMTADKLPLTFESIKPLVEDAMKIIAPVWPLHRLVAVNPWWNEVHKPWHDCAATLSTCGGIQPMMPLSYYKKMFQTGQILEMQLKNVLKRHNWNSATHIFLDKLDNEAPPPSYIKVLSELPGNTKSKLINHRLDEYIQNHISHFCAAFFAKKEISNNLYQHWLTQAKSDASLRIRFPEIHGLLQKNTLPENWQDLIINALSLWPMSKENSVFFLQALILRIKGWASWCAFLQQEHENSSHLFQLLAIRLSWEILVSKTATYHAKNLQWQQTINQWHDWYRQWFQHYQYIMIWQEASEEAFQDQFKQGLRDNKPCYNSDSQQLDLQAFFCIDVRSEPVRSALEQTIKNSKTYGFAGFFGLPLASKANALTKIVPQLPVLFAPAISVDSVENTSSSNQAQEIQWKAIQKNMLASFSYVENMGIKDTWQLIRRSFIHPSNHRNQSTITGCNYELYDMEKQSKTSYLSLLPYIRNFIECMNLQENFARTILIVGHASQSENNPHRSSLDCGACGGQSGEINAQVLADALNDIDIRNALIEDQILIPSDTVCIAGLHNTTTDTITLLPSQHDTPEIIQRFAMLQSQLEQVNNHVQKGRSHEYKDELSDNISIQDVLSRKANDWSETQPEWGLAGNAGFYIGPRTSTRPINLNKRFFLHDYDWQADREKKHLEQILTGPLIVAHWINFQYYASVTDNQHYGSGDKALHNIIADNLGILEGGSGDLRIGLSYQSLYDGEHLMHEPLRLSVFIEAPQDMIADIIEKHDILTYLVNNGWIHLFSIDPKTKYCHAYHRGEWQLRPPLQLYG